MINNEKRRKQRSLLRGMVGKRIDKLRKREKKNEKSQKIDRENERIKKK